jgi:Tol biopolymer transport system component
VRPDADGERDALKAAGVATGASKLGVTEHYAGTPYRSVRRESDLEPKMQITVLKRDTIFWSRGRRPRIVWSSLARKQLLTIFIARPPVRYVLALSTFVVAAGSGGVLAWSPGPQAAEVPQKVVVDLPGVEVNDIAMSPNTKFVYYADRQAVLMYDRVRKRSTTLLTRTAYDLAMAPRGNLLAFGGVSEDQKQFHIFALALDTATGLAVGAPRRVSVEQGDSPSVSPDGKWIAFAAYDSPDWKKQRLAVIPSTGGSERVLSRHGGGIGPIRWTPDGKWLYYGVYGTSVGEAAQGQATYRVAVAGGTATLFEKSHDGHGYPGLSPDARLLVVKGTRADNYVYDSTGRRLGTYPFRSDHRSVTWSGPSSVLVVNSPPSVVLQSLALRTGQAKTIGMPSGTISEPEWSPTGKQVAMTYFSTKGDTTAVLVMNPDGSGQRRTAIPVLRTWSKSWSPDGRWIAYAGVKQSMDAPVGATVVGVVEAATGRHVPLSLGVTGAPQWTRDSKRLLIAVLADSSAGAGGKYRMQIHEVTLAGGDRVVGERRGDALSLQVISDSTAISIPAAGGPGFIVPLRGGAPVATFPAVGRYSWATVTPDGTRMAFRSGDHNQNFNMLHVTRIDGAEHTTIPLSFAALPGHGNPAFLPGNNELIVAGAMASRDSVAFYRVNITTKAMQRIHVARRANLEGIQFAVSPDGSTLMHVTRIPPNNSIVELDLSGFLKPAPR